MVNILPLIFNFQAFVLIIIIKLPTFDPKTQTSSKIIQENTSIIMIGPKCDYWLTKKPTDTNVKPTHATFR